MGIYLGMSLVACRSMSMYVGLPDVGTMWDPSWMRCIFMTPSSRARGIGDEEDEEEEEEEEDEDSFTQSAHEV